MHPPPIRIDRNSVYQPRPVAFRGPPKVIPPPSEVASLASHNRLDLMKYAGVKMEKRMLPLRACNEVKDRLGGLTTTGAIRAPRSTVNGRLAPQLRPPAQPPLVQTFE